MKPSAAESLLLPDGAPDARDRKTSSTRNCPSGNISNSNARCSERRVRLLLWFSEPAEELRHGTRFPVSLAHISLVLGSHRRALLIFVAQPRLSKDTSAFISFKWPRLPCSGPPNVAGRRLQQKRAQKVGRKLINSLETLNLATSGRCGET